MSGNVTTHKRMRSGVHRRRAILSCQSCRLRRLKCDRNRPVCGRCAQTEEQCIWAVDGSLRFPSEQQGAAQPSVTSEEHPTKEDVHMDSGSDLSAPEDLSPTATPHGDRPSTSWTGYLTSQQGGRSRYVPSSFWANIDHDVGTSGICKDRIDILTEYRTGRTPFKHTTLPVPGVLLQSSLCAALFFLD